jgi:prevent-host-death family protein
MITVGSREAKAGFSELLDSAQSDDVVILRHGKPVAVLTGVAGADMEELFWSTNDDLQKQIKRTRENPRPVPHEEARKRLGLR